MSRADPGSSIKGDPENVEIDFIESRVSDYSGIEAISGIVGKYEKEGKKITLKHLSFDCKKLLNKWIKNIGLSSWKRSMIQGIMLWPTPNSFHKG